MDLFNKTFFRFAFGFIGIIVVSMSIIFISQAMSKDAGATACVGECGR